MDTTRCCNQALDTRYQEGCKQWQEIDKERLREDRSGWNIPPPPPPKKKKINPYKAETARSGRPSKTPLFVAFLSGTAAGYVMDFHRSKHDS